MRRKQTLGYIVKDKLEYRVPSHAVTALLGSYGADDIDALCGDRTEFVLGEVARRLKEMDERKRASPTSAYPAYEPLQTLAESIQREEKKLRAKGVKGNIPVCIYREGFKAPRYLRKAVANHERFHADVRRVEHEAGFSKPLSCADGVEKELRQHASDRLLAYSKMLWASEPPRAAEEVLARVEEIRKACLHSKKECAALKRKLNSMFSSTDAPVKRDLLATASKVNKKYGTPLNLVRKVLRACKVPR